MHLVRRNFLNDRVTLIWNKLPTEVKISSSLIMFLNPIWNCLNVKLKLWEHVVQEIFGKSLMKF